MLKGSLQLDTEPVITPGMGSDDQGVPRARGKEGSAAGHPVKDRDEGHPNYTQGRQSCLGSF